MSVDQSFSNFAVTVFNFEDEHCFKVVDRIVIHTGEDVESNKKKQYGQFFPTVQQQLQYTYSLFKPFFEQHKPDNLVFEGLAFGAQGDRVFSLGGLYFYITTKLFEDGLISPEDLIKVAPTSVKKLARTYLDNHDQVCRDKEGKVIVNKSGKPKINNMEKKFMIKALANTEGSWIVEGYSASSDKIETGLGDLADSYFIGLCFIKGLHVKDKKKQTKKKSVKVKPEVLVG